MRVCRVLGFLLAVFIVSSGVAQAIPLSTLIGGQTISAGDKTYGDFSFLCASGNCTAEGITTANINVAASFDAINDIGYLEFSGSMISNTLVDFVIKYSVTSLRPIIMIDQSFNLTANPVGGQILIAEDVRTGSFAGTIVANSTIGFSGGSDLNDPDPEVGDDLIISPGITKAWVTKDVNIAPNAGGGRIGTSVLLQSFHQAPEPTSLVLLGAGLAGLAAWRKRSK